MKVNRLQLIKKIEEFVVNKQKKISENPSLAKEYERQKQIRENRIRSFIIKSIPQFAKMDNRLKHKIGWKGNLDIDICIFKEEIPQGLTDEIPDNLVAAHDFNEQKAWEEVNQAKSNISFLFMSPSETVDLKPGCMKDFLKYV